MPDIICDYDNCTSNLDGKCNAPEVHLEANLDGMECSTMQYKETIWMNFSHEMKMGEQVTVEGKLYEVHENNPSPGPGIFRYGLQEVVV
jgi:hypothetical protein